MEKCLELFPRTYVSSDDAVILTLATKAGAIPIQRGEELCGDVPDITVFQHAVKHMHENVGWIMAVHANNPTLSPNLIYKMHDAIVSLELDEVMTCYPMTRTENYHDQHNRIYGSIRGLSIERLKNYPDPYRPEPQVLFIDDSIEIETQESYDAALCQSKLPS